MLITTSIVLYKTNNKQLESVVDSLFNSKESDLELIIVDNSPQRTDISNLQKRSRTIDYIWVGENIGYGKAHNIALRMAVEKAADYHIILNPDIVFEPNVIGELTNYLERNRDVIYIMPKVLYPNGSVQYLCKLLPRPLDLFLRRFLPNTRWSRYRNEQYVLKQSGYDKIINPPCLSGCFMFMRVLAIKDKNLYFDERFFMYFEDFDLIRRCHKYGKTIFYPDLTIVHDHAKESYTNYKLLIRHIISAVKYFNKYGWFVDIERKKMNLQILREIEQIKT